MTRALLILLLGLACGLGAHFGWLAATQTRGHDQADPLAWMRSSLQLSDTQWHRIRALHENSAPGLRALAQQAEQMRAELVAFERERVTQGQIDFLEFARFVEARRQLDTKCLLSKQDLIAAVSAEMTPRQRELYRILISPALTAPMHEPAG